MLSVIQSPPDVAITGNPIRFTLESDNYLETTGVKAICTMHFSDTGQAGDQFDLTWNNKTITIVCSGAPDNSGNQIPDRTLFAILADWTSAIATALSLNYYLSKNFIITSNAGEVIFTAREFGPEFNLSWNTTWNNPQPYLSVISGVAQTTHLFFKAGILVDLFIGSNYQTIAEELLPVDHSGQVRFDIHKMFSDRLFSEFTFPESSDNLIVLRENSCRGYRIRAYEQYGEDLTARKMIQSDQFHVLSAGISYLQEAIYNRQGSSFWEKLTYNDYFLTWQPKTKFIDRYQTEKLFFLVQSAITSLDLVIKTYFTDGTVSTSTIESLTDPTVKSVYEIILSLNTIQIPGYDNNTIKKFDAWMEDGASNRISEIRTFEMDTGIHENIRYFLFLNSLGGYDTLRITGDQQDGMQYTRTSVSKVLGEGFTEKDHKSKTESVRERRKYTANTGWKTREDIAWIRDFFLSKQVYVINTGKLVPVEITTTEATQRQDRVELYNIEFEYQRAFTSEFYTRQLVAADFNDDFNDDFANE